jgi:hypothetical protein
MKSLGLMAWFLLLVTPLVSQTQVPAAQRDKPTSVQPCLDPTAKPEPRGDPVQLNGVKKIFVESFGDDVISKEIQSMIVSSLVGSKRFTVTENRNRADAVLKGGLSRRRRKKSMLIVRARQLGQRLAAIREVSVEVGMGAFLGPRVAALQITALE